MLITTRLIRLKHGSWAHFSLQISGITFTNRTSKKWFRRKCNSEIERKTTVTISKNPNFKSSLSFVWRSTN